jgi:hypothetical protein
MKICSVGTELFHADGQIDRQKYEAKARFSQFFKRTFYMHICTSKQVRVVEALYIYVLR